MQAEKLLVLRLSSLGDLILTSSFLESLHQEFPEGTIDFVVREDLIPAAELLPHVNRVVAVPRRASLTRLLWLARELSRADYDHVFDVHRSLRSRLLTCRLASRLRGGFEKQSLARWLLIHTKKNWYERLGGSSSLRQRMLQPLVNLGRSPCLEPTRLVIPDKAREQVRDHLALADAPSWIGVAPAARWPSKMWPLERFAQCIQELARVDNHRFLLFGSESEAPLVGAAALKAPERCETLAGHIDLAQTAAYLERCAVVLTNDSAMLHMAEAMGTPVVALFGPTAPEFGYAPYRDESRLLRRAPWCSPCSKNGQRPCMRPTHECMENIGVAEVVETVQSVLRARKPTESHPSSQGES